jgi:hypothetical protein
MKAFKEVWPPGGAGLKEIKGLGEDPGVSDGGSAYHYSIAPGFPLHSQYIIRPLDVPVAYNRNRNRIFEPGDQRPIRPSAKPLRGGPGVDGHGINAALFRNVRCPDCFVS